MSVVVRQHMAHAVQGLEPVNWHFHCTQWIFLPLVLVSGCSQWIRVKCQQRLNRGRVRRDQDYTVQFCFWGSEAGQVKDTFLLPRPVFYSMEPPHGRVLFMVTVPSVLVVVLIRSQLMPRLEIETTIDLKGFVKWAELVCFLRFLEAILV